MREAYRMVFEMEPEMELCGVARDATEALAAIGPARPDLVIVDVSLPGMSGLELVEQLGRQHPSLPALVVSGHHEALYAERAFRAGARGYLDKKGLSTVLIEAIHCILDGGVYQSERLREGG